MPAPASSKLVTFRNAFISGALLVAPLVVTLWAFSKVIDLVGGTFRPFFFFYLPEMQQHSFAVLLDILATLIVVLLVTALGYVSRYVFGKFFLSIAERFILKIPVLSAVYATVKQIVDTFGVNSQHMFNKVVLVEFPRPGSWTLGFLTSHTQGEAQTKTGHEVYSVFVPTTPNPTSGFLIMVPPREVVELDMSVGEGMKMIISGGAVMPPWPGPARPSAAAEDAP